MRRVLEECYDLCAPLEGSITEGLLSGYLMFWDIRTGVSAPTNKESYGGCLWEYVLALWKNEITPPAGSTCGTSKQRAAKNKKTKKNKKKSDKRGSVLSSIVNGIFLF
ncbi:hypothetical protein AcV5_005180 [Taiwanofungus camphoratus]|nr:hypothetical protein AcV5_005180 [Antrodia cinnamomea]